MKEFFALFDVGIVINVAISVATLVFSQKIKDFFAGVPSHTRASIKQIEVGVLAKVKAYEAEVVSAIIPPPAPVAKPVAAVPLVPPVAPEPAAPVA